MVTLKSFKEFQRDNPTQRQREIEEDRKRAIELNSISNQGMVRY